jgi:hypothetical protein
MPVPQSMCAQIGLQMTMEIAIYLFIGLSMAYWLVLMRIDDMKQAHYWRGRKDGFDMHRRMIQNKVKTDEVFDYDKN